MTKKTQIHREQRIGTLDHISTKLSKYRKRTTSHQELTDSSDHVDRMQHKPTLRIVFSV